MNKRIRFSVEIIYVVILIISLFAVRYQQFTSSLKSIEGDEFAWITTSLFEKHNILPSEKGLWVVNDGVAESFPTSLKINELGFYIFGTDIYSARKILALFSILSMLTFYLLCRRFFSPIISFCMTILFSLSTYKLITARIAVEPAYADLFLYLSLALILLISEKNNHLNYVYSALAVLGTILGTFTYALSFFFPVLGLALILIQVIKNKLKLKEKVIILLIFIIPLIVITPKWIKNIQLETERKDYGLHQMVFDFKKKQFSLANLSTNIYIVHKSLFKTLAYRASDMVVSYENTIIPEIIVYLAMVGFVLSLFKIKRYYPIQVWIGLSFMPMILLGLISARMWINLVSVFFLFAGITVQNLINLKEVKNHKFMPFFLLFFTFFVVSSNLYEYYNFALKNSAFLPKIGEIVKLSKAYKSNLALDAAFISDEDFSQGTIYPATTFYYLAQHPEDKTIKYMTREEMLVFTYDTFMDFGQYNLNEYKYVVVDNVYLEDIKNLIKTETGKNIKKKEYEYFSLLEL